jgi:hypothetical protein
MVGKVFGIPRPGALRDDPIRFAVPAKAGAQE